MKKSLVIISLITLYISSNAQNRIDSIVYHLPVYQDSLSIFDELKLVNIYLEMEYCVNKELWTSIDIERAYYVRLDYFDLVKDIIAHNYYPIKENTYKVLLWCAIWEMDIFERLNHISEQRKN